MMTSDEVTAHCPITNQPDFYTVIVEYVPDKLCIESKSLKLYLEHFRSEQLFCEQLPVIIRDKIIEIVAPRSCKVTVVQKVRGGIMIRAEAGYGE